MMADIQIVELLRNAKHPLLSLEFFPPKSPTGFQALEDAVAQMQNIQPDFTTVTYGAGGTTRHSTMNVCQLLHDVKMRPVMPHLTCVGSTQTELRELADSIYESGFRNIMALRGDPPSGADIFQAPQDGCAYANELVTLLKQQHPDFCCGVAGYPESHPESVSAQIDIDYLRKKMDAGADFITTQLFYDNSMYFRFVENCRAAGITQPIIPGLLPAVSLKQIERIIKLCRASFPKELANQMEAAGGSGPEAEAVGMNWTVNQIKELLKNGAPAIHLYVLNRAQTVQAPSLAKCISQWRKPTF